MKNAYLPAMPTWCHNSDQQLYGLTKREHFAAMVMQGLASESGRYSLPSDMASDAVKLADALLTKLEKSK